MHIAQGDSPSPLLYNFVGQILLFKIELNPRIVPACPRKIGLVPYEPFDPFEHESNKETSTCECFADDNSTFTRLCYHSLSELKNNMDAFRILSGLSCNIDKTFIMRIGDLSGEISENILSLGFKFVYNVKILGFEVSNSHQWDLNNFHTVTENIRKLIQFWSRFRLTLAGKITIYKTLLMPQLNFYATVITPSVQTFETLTVMMNGFVTQGMQIAKSRPYTSPREGGIGLFDLRAFVASLQFTWVKRDHLCCNVNWKYDLREMCGGEIVGIGNLINTNIGLCGPLLLGIIDSFKTFHDKFASTGKNFTLLPIYCNHLFGHGQNMQNKFDNVFFLTRLKTDF